MPQRKLFKTKILIKTRNVRSHKSKYSILHLYLYCKIVYKSLKIPRKAATCACSLLTVGYTNVYLC